MQLVNQQQLKNERLDSHGDMSDGSQSRGHIIAYANQWDNDCKMAWKPVKVILNTWFNISTCFSNKKNFTPVFTHSFSNI